MIARLRDWIATEIAGWVIAHIATKEFVERYLRILATGNPDETVDVADVVREKFVACDDTAMTPFGEGVIMHCARKSGHDDEHSTDREIGPDSVTWRRVEQPEGTILVLKSQWETLLAVGTLYVNAFGPDEMMPLGARMNLQSVEEIIEQHGPRY